MPGPDTVLAGPPGWVVAAFQAAVSTPDSNRIESAQIQAARDAGYTRAAGYSTAQQIAVGQGLRSADAFAASQGGGPGDINRQGPMRAAAQTMPVPVPSFPNFPPVTNYPTQQIPPQIPGGSGSSGIPPGGVRPPSGPGPVDPNASPTSTVQVTGAWPYVIAGVIGPDIWNWVKIGGKWVWTHRNDSRPLPKGPRNPRGRGPHRGPGPKQTDAGRGDPFPAKGPDTPAPAPVYVPRADRVAAVLGQLGGDIWVNRRRLPVPKMPRPRPVSPPPPPPKPLWQQLLPIIGPALLSYLLPASGNRSVLRLTDPLSTPTSSSLTSSMTSVASYGAFGGTPGQVGTNTCECKAPRKKGRKKKRTVCYSGTYIERADGTRKTKKRKVACK